MLKFHSNFISGLGSKGRALRFQKCSNSIEEIGQSGRHIHDFFLNCKLPLAYGHLRGLEKEVGCVREMETG